MVNPDPNSAIGQSQSSYDAFSQYFSNLYQYLTSGGTCPEFSDSVGGLDYSELHRIAAQGATMSPNYPNAASVENVHHIAAVMREYGIRTKSKNQYYSDGQSDTQNESTFYSSMKTFYSGMLQGIYTPGTTS
jgi:hypothetical protein